MTDPVSQARALVARPGETVDETDARFIAVRLADEVDRLRAEAGEAAHQLALTQQALVRESLECFKGNIDAINKLGLDHMAVQPILMAVQSWDISSGRARELIRAWVLGTYRDEMLPGCKDLGLGEDDDPGDVLMKARDRLAAADRLAEDVPLLVKFLQDAPRLDFNEDQTLSWIGVMTERVNAALAAWEASK